ncbi:hypothetical protein TNCV_1864781 [Trichonephila clavipes]|nr:hypothetical protein TNCV_1864781 [Trichonephila clavipes]
MPEKYKTPPRNARSNTITAKGTELEFTKVITAMVSIPVSIPINTRNEIDDLQLVDIKCGQTSIKAVIDTEAQISVLRKDLIGKSGEEEEQARLKAEVEARLKAEVETEAVEKRRRMEEERRMNERIALEEEMRLKKERWLVKEQIRHVQEEHKNENERRTEERCKKANEEVLFKSERVQQLSVDPDAVEQPVAVEEKKGLARDSSNVLPISAKDEAYEITEKPKLPKRKLKELSGMSVTKLQQKVNLKASNKVVLVLQYWSFKHEYSQNKREIGKLAWKLLGFIKRIGIGKVQQSLQEREDQETAKVKMRKQVRLKLRTHDNISWDFLSDMLFLSGRRERNWTFAFPPLSER